MKKLFIISLVFLAFNSIKAFANPGDTVVVQTFSFGSPQDAWFVFPSDTLRCEKVLMKYTLKCNPAQSPACGEWDYLTYTYLYKHTHLLDSTLVHQPVYTVNGATPSTYGYMNSPSYSYHPSWQYYMVNTGTTSLNTYTVGAGTANSTIPFGSSQPVSHTQYLWKASEITSAGMSAGNISGLQFYLQTLGGSLRNLTIRMKTSPLDSLSQSTYSDSVFTTVYSQNTQFTTVGWNSLQFTTPFNWNGTSNLLIDITYDNTVSSTDNQVAATATTFNSTLNNSGNDRVASFHSAGYVSIPLNNKLVSIDSFVTVTLWCFGSPSLQPMNGTAFEAVDSLGHRLLNSHLPWSDSNVYWDAGYGGTSYDRINKVAVASEIKGQWNHWAFTKNTVTGVMNIYLNGNLWFSGTGKTKSMKGIKNFRIGQGNWGGSQTYEGKIDEFAVFNSELSQATIQSYMYKQIDAVHPNYNNLAVYYHFDDGNYLTFADAAPGSHPLATLNSVDNPFRDANQIITDFSVSNLRPNVIFEQGVYTQHLDSVLVVDSTMNVPVQIITYNDSTNNPGVVTSTYNVWPAYYHNYLYNAQGVAYDSTLVTPDSTLNEVYYNWYRKFPQVIRYELARFITPYGNNLSLGNGFTWTFDVSDYRTLLADSVHLNAGNWQELLDVKFLLIKGIPPRDPIAVKNLWNGGFNYGTPTDSITHLQSLNLNIPSNAFNSRWKSRITGHGMDTPNNCSEFCAIPHYFKVNGTQQFSKTVWRDNCDVNPVYPQGGTWIYSRANWCPGAEVWTYDWELTPFTIPGNPVTLNHSVAPYTHTGSWDYFQIEDQLVTYGGANFTLDAAVEDIISPSTDQMWKRMNPVCTNPVVKIKNTGSTTLTSLDITYGLVGGVLSTYHWTGNLKFTESATVTLGTFAWLQGATDFTVSVSNPNGGADQYANNNVKLSHFTYPTVMPSQMVIVLKTNNYPQENQYTLKDEAGNVIISRSNMAANYTYKDTLNLANGCYTFELTDNASQSGGGGGDGLSFWNNANQGSGYLQFRKVTPNATIKTFGSDFGGQIYQQFTVGLTSNVNEYIFTDKALLNVYPNPTDGHVYINVDFAKRNDGRIEVLDMFGKKVYTHQLTNITADMVEADLSFLKKGIYFVTLRTGDEFVSKKLVIQ